MLWQTRCQTLDLTHQAAVIAVLNVTPDSFSDGGRFLSEEAAREYVEVSIAEGAAIVDVGGESSRPGSEPVSAEVEMARVIPVIRMLRQAFPRLLISIDTTKSMVADAALRAGADILNDISGFRAEGMVAVARESGAGVILMHMLGTPKDMQTEPRYRNVMDEVASYLEAGRDRLVAAGIASQRIALDPGFGFGKRLIHNVKLLRDFDYFLALGQPLVAGVSRKSFVGQLSELENQLPVERTWANIALACFLREKGARLLRVHDVQATLQALRETENYLSHVPDTH